LIPEIFSGRLPLFNSKLFLYSLNGIVLNEIENRLKYITNYLSNFLIMLESLSNIAAQEALGFSQIIRKMTLFFPPSIFSKIQANLHEAYLKKLTQLTCHFIKEATAKTRVSLA